MSTKTAQSPNDIEAKPLTQRVQTLGNPLIKSLNQAVKMR